LGAGLHQREDALGPNALLQVERSLSVLDGSGLGTRAKLYVLTAVDTYVTGSVLNELREVRAEQARAKAGLTDIDIAASMQAWWDRLDRSGMFVRVLRIFSEGSTRRSRNRDDRFEFGLACLLTGCRPAPSSRGLAVYWLTADALDYTGCCDVMNLWIHRLLWR